MPERLGFARYSAIDHEVVYRRRYATYRREEALSRPKHPRPELEALLKEAEAKGWQVVKGRKYFKMSCPCADKHLTWVHLTPGQYYVNHLRGLLRRDTCWEARP